MKKKEEILKYIIDNYDVLVNNTKNIIANFNYDYLYNTETDIINDIYIKFNDKEEKKLESVLNIKNYLTTTIYNEIKTIISKNNRQINILKKYKNNMEKNINNIIEENNDDDDIMIIMGQEMYDFIVYTFNDTELKFYVQRYIYKKKYKEIEELLKCKRTKLHFINVEIKEKLNKYLLKKSHIL